MKLILLAYLLLALCWRPLRRWNGVHIARLGHAVRLWRQLQRPWRVAWAMARRRHP